MYYPCRENKGADKLRSYCELICAFVFTYADCWFSHAAAHYCFSAICEGFNLDSSFSYKILCKNKLCFESET